MLTYLKPRRRRSHGPVLTERGQGLAILLLAIAGLFWIVAQAKGVA